jgi:hypothetical protein
MSNETHNRDWREHFIAILGDPLRAQANVEQLEDEIIAERAANPTRYCIRCHLPTTACTEHGPFELPKYRTHDEAAPFTADGLLGVQR